VLHLNDTDACFVSSYFLLPFSMHCNFLLKDQHRILGNRNNKGKLVLFLPFWDRVSLCSPGWPGTQSSCPSLSSARIIGVCPHTSNRPFVEGFMLIKLKVRPHLLLLTAVGIKDIGFLWCSCYLMFLSFRWESASFICLSCNSVSFKLKEVLLV
jgi:hypothetical protein